MLYLHAKGKCYKVVKVKDIEKADSIQVQYIKN